MTAAVPPEMITVSALNDFQKVRHGFFTRTGGASAGIYGSLNCGPGSQDDPAAVAANRALVAESFDLPADALTTVYQQHTATVEVLTAPRAPGTPPPVADALVTNCPGLLLGILTADCAPVLLADPKAGVIAAAHAGWKGALGGVLDNTIAAMQTLGAKPDRIVAAIGPCIGARSYEVGPEFPAPFLAETPDNHFFFVPSYRAGYFLFDLPGYVARRLGRHKLADVSRTPCDTLRETGRFFSYRRATLTGEKDYGRQISVIALDR